MAGRQDAVGGSHGGTLTRPPVGESWSGFLRLLLDRMGRPRIDDLALYLKISRESVRHWLHGTREPGEDQRVALVAMWESPPVLQRHLGEITRSSTYWMKSRIERVRQKPRLPPPGVQRLFTLWMQTQLRGRIGCLQVAEGVEWEAGRTSVLWTYAHTGVGPTVVPQTVDYPSTDALCAAILARGQGPWDIAWRDA